MPIERVVVNSSPLITLFKSGQADLLPRLFSEIVVPAAVRREVVSGGPTDAAARALPTIDWVERKEVVVPSVIQA